MNKFNSCTLALLIGSFFALNAAHAQDKTPTAPTNPMVDALTERGFVALSDGLYSNPSLSSKS